MTWGRLDDNFHSHPKTVQMGLEGAGLQARAISYAGAYLTDGFVPREWARSVAPAKVIRRLVSLGAWAEVDGGYEIVGFLDYNPSRADVEEKRRLERERQTRYRARTNGDVTRDKTGDVNGPRPEPIPRPEMRSVDEEINNGHGLDVAPFLAELKDCDEKTPSILRALGSQLPEAAFHTALESLKERRARGDREPLRSETAYFISALASMKREGQYA